MRPHAGPIRMWGKVKVEAPQLEWDGVRARLEGALHYWLTVDRVSRPVWGVWLDDMLLLTVGSSSLWRELKRYEGWRGPASAHLEDALDVVVVEGQAARETDESLIARMVEPYNLKYGWDLTPDSASPLVALRPDVVLAWQTVPPEVARESPFPVAAGRFTFHPDDD